MTTRPLIQIDEEVREMTNEEFDSFSELQKTAQEEEAARDIARKSARAKLIALGLTEAEIAAL